MIVRAVLLAKRRDFAIAVVVYCSACTSMLGIDGDYAAGPPTEDDTGLASGGQDTGSGGLHSMITPGSGGATRFDAGAAARGGGPNSGGARQMPEPATGGAMHVGAGGSGASTSGSGGATGGAPSGGGVPPSGGSVGTEAGGAGGVPPDIDAAVPVCPTGTFTGLYRGTHKPGTPISILSAPIAGPVTLRFTATGTTSATAMGSLLDPLDDTTGGVAAALRGTIDCATGTGSVTTSSPGEVTTVVPSPYFALVDVSVEIKVGKTGNLSGGFTIRETGNSMATGTGTGTGSWSASH